MNYVSKFEKIMSRRIVNIARNWFGRVKLTLSLYESESVERQKMVENHNSKSHFVNVDLAKMVTQPRIVILDVERTSSPRNNAIRRMHNQWSKLHILLRETLSWEKRCAARLENPQVRTLVNVPRKSPSGTHLVPHIRPQILFIKFAIIIHLSVLRTIISVW